MVLTDHLPRLDIHLNSCLTTGTFFAGLFTLKTKYLVCASKDYSSSLQSYGQRIFIKSICHTNHSPCPNPYKARFAKEKKSELLFGNRSVVFWKKTNVIVFANFYSTLLLKRMLILNDLE